MTTATTEGRRLVLAVDGIDEPFLVDPVPARRGRYLTEQFVSAALQRLAPDETEAIFIESINPDNYSRMSGFIVDEFDNEGEYVRSWNPDGDYVRDNYAPQFPERTHPVRYRAREAVAGELESDGEAIRQEECESLCLCAFYWQTVVGMEAVNAFIQGGEGQAGSLKAMSLLQIRLGFSNTPNSSSAVMASLIQQEASSVGTSDTRNSSALERLPEAKRSRRRTLKGRKPQ